MTPVFERILNLKRESGLSWDELAKAAGIKVGSWMTGLPTCTPSDQDLKALAPVLKTTYKYLKNGD